MRIKKQTAVKEDGRLIVYYSFPKDAKSKEAKKKSERN